MSGRFRDLFASRLVIAILVLAGLLTLPLWVSAYILGVLTIAYYFGVFAMSWDLLFGFANEVNFGPTFLIGSGAYAAGLLNSQGVPLWLCLIAGAAAAHGSVFRPRHAGCGSSAAAIHHHLCGQHRR
jgi:branched-chain amino acid transport system permease protein